MRSVVEIYSKNTAGNSASQSNNIIKLDCINRLGTVWRCISTVVNTYHEFNLKLQEAEIIFDVVLEITLEVDIHIIIAVVMFIAIRLG